MKSNLNETSFGSILILINIDLNNVFNKELLFLCFLDDHLPPDGAAIVDSCVDFTHRHTGSKM